MSNKPAPEMKAIARQEINEARFESRLPLLKTISDEVTLAYFRKRREIETKLDQLEEDEWHDFYQRSQFGAVTPNS